MSRCYRIEVSEKLRRHIEVDDGIAIHLELLDILPPERMRSLLADQLKQRGYAPGETGMTRTLEDGITVTVTDDGEVHIGLTADAELELETRRAARTYRPDDDKLRGQLEDRAREELETEAAEAQERLRVETTKKLEAALDGIREELDKAVTRATAEALKEKARQLGEVQEISENEETGEVTIRVKV